MSSPSVLVTGGSGFLGGYCILALLEKGYQVRTTIRSLSKESNVKEALSSGGATSADLTRLSIFEADLNKDQGWAKAIEGCTYILHTASPIPVTIPKDENELVIPARDGTLRVLKFAKQAGVKRVVFTSSFNAVGYGHPDQAKPFTEESWSNEKAKLGAYPRSKVVAEKAAWDYVKNGAGNGLELTTINPVAMFGPPLLNNTELAASLHIIQRYLTGEMPASLNLWMSVVDVRDVAALHVLAMTSPAAQGERFIAVAGGGWMQDIPITLKEKLSADVTQKVSTKVLPNIVTRMAGWFDRQVGSFVPELGRRKASSSEKAISLLGWSPRPREDTLVDTAQTLIKLGWVKTT